jgi:hypothetical protein
MRPREYWYTPLASPGRPCQDLSAMMGGAAHLRGMVSMLVQVRAKIETPVQTLSAGMYR